MARVKAELDKSKAFNEKMEAANAKHTADFEKAARKRTPPHETPRKRFHPHETRMRARLAQRRAGALVTETCLPARHCAARVQEEDIKDCKSSISNEIRKEKKRQARRPSSPLPSHRAVPPILSQPHSPQPPSPRPLSTTQDVIKKNETNLAAAKKELAELEAPTEMLDPDELARAQLLPSALRSLSARRRALSPRVPALRRWFPAPPALPLPAARACDSPSLSHVQVAVQSPGNRCR